MGLLPIVLHTDADVARAFCHKRGVARMKHLDVKHCWLQEELEKGNLIESSMRVTCLLTVPLQRVAKVPSHDRLPHDDCEQRKLQCSRDDAEGDAAAKVTAFLTSMADVAKS